MVICPICPICVYMRILCHLTHNFAMWYITKAPYKSWIIIRNTHMWITCGYYLNKGVYSPLYSTILHLYPHLAKGDSHYK